MSIEIREANFRDPRDGEALLQVLGAYAQDAMGGAKPLGADAARRLVPALAAHPGAHALLAWAELRPIGVATCFLGFSTFAARPLLNVHDLAVVPDFRRRGVARALLTSAEALARANGCVKLTLEVLEDNAVARELYHSFGFRDYELGGVQRRTFFLAKPLTT